jgi:NAD(P)-dependent dehydrogenase (short-subunit alcohol dehydrogenase family)
MNAFGLEGKTALVTGSTAGIGFAIAQRLAENGCTVYVNGRTDASCKKAIEELSSFAKKDLFVACPGDLSSLEGCNQVFGKAKSVDILINNVGIFPVCDFLDFSDEQWEDIINVNFMSGVRASRHYLKLMLEQKNQFGRIIFISSESGYQIPHEMIHYGVTKTMQISLSRGLAVLCKGTGVTANTILPGPTKTPGLPF